MSYPKTVFITEFKYTPKLARLVITGQTPKRFNVQDVKEIVGFIWIGTFIPKAKYNIFDTYDEAMEWCIKRSYEYAQNAQAKADKYLAQADKLRKDYDEENQSSGLRDLPPC